MEFLVRFIGLFFELLTWTIVIKILLSWFGNPRNWFTDLVSQIADPVLSFFRRPYFRIGMIDFSPIVAILVLDLVGVLLIRLIVNL